MANKGKVQMIVAGVLLVIVLLLVVLFNERGYWVAPWLVAGLIATPAALVAHSLLGGLQQSKIKVETLQMAGGGAALLGIWLIGNHFLQVQMKPGDSLHAQRATLENLHSSIAGAKKELAVEEQKLARVKQQLEGGSRTPKTEASPDVPSVVDQVAKLNPNSAEASDIRRMVTTRKGPWGTKAREADYMLSVAGKQRGRVASACDELNFDLETVDLTSLLIKDDQSYGSAGPVRVSRWRPLGHEVCKRFQIQISCEIARELLTDDVISCDDAGGFTWKAGFGGSFVPVRAVVVANEGGAQ